ncbi:hypothetical protein [Evansella clarkii]|uniref:hypothetical protein n=1 Tax=Evansella clarkii TaxID=79879 RepID=UPI0009970571|nr:hypothetical protein [Evansella clarkii]
MSQQSKWAEIRNDYIEEDGVFHVLHVDAWRTDDDNEETEVIAKLVGINKDGKSHIYLSYHNPDAQIDPYAKEVIQEADKLLREHLNDQFLQPHEAIYPSLKED